MNAIDTNILIYSIDRSNADKQERAISLLETLSESDTILPWQVACEVAAVLRKMQRLGRFAGNYPATLAALRGCFPIATPRVPVLARAVDIETKSTLSMWDSLLIAACEDAGVTRLYSEDLQSGLSVAGVTIVDPFESRR